VIFIDTSVIKQSVSMSEVCRIYGIEINNQGFSHCPFHGGDNTPSLKIYPDGKGFYCFGCGAGGDVIKFVQLLFKISFAQAILRLDTDFSLGLSRKKADDSEVRKRRQEVADRQLKENALIEKHKKLCIIHRLYLTAINELKPHDPNENPQRLFVEAIKNIDSISYRIEAIEEELWQMKNNRT